MTNKKVIDMSKVVGTDTLCEFSKPSKQGIIRYYSGKSIEQMNVPFKVAEDIWQSTANNLVIPDGLIVDFEYFDYVEGLCAKSSFPSENIREYQCHFDVTAIKVTGVQEGYRYAWEAEDVA